MLIKDELNLAINVLSAFAATHSAIDNIRTAGDILVQCLIDGNKIFTCGNGGSHCEAMHFAEELSGRYRKDRKGLAALAISDPTHISCVGNDLGFNQVFSRYIESLGKEGDALVCFSTSGNSENILLAAKEAKSRGISVIGLTGKDGGKLADLCDVEIRVPHEGWADRVQEVHTVVMHILINLIEKGVIGE